MLPGWSQVVKPADTRGGLRPDPSIAAIDGVYKILAKPLYPESHPEPGAQMPEFSV